MNNSDVPTLKRVLCALDVDDSRRGPLELASAIAHGFRASVDALYAPAPLFAFGGRAERVRRLIAEHDARERLQALLVPFATRATQLQPYITRGQPGDVILSHSAQHRSDLIVLGRPTGAFAVQSGNVSSSVASAAGCAVLTSSSKSSELSLRRVLLPLGPSLAAACATNWAIALAGRFNVEIDLVRIAAPRTGFWRSLRAPESLDAERSDRQTLAVARLMMSRLNDAGVTATLRSEKFMADDVIELAASGAFDLVVTGLQGRIEAKSSGEDFVEELRRRSEVSVLSVRARRSTALRISDGTALEPSRAEQGVSACA